MEIFTEKLVIKEIRTKDNFISIIDQLLLDISISYPIVESLRFRMKLALVEAVCNGVKHGNELCKNKTVYLTMFSLENKYRFQIKDEGRGYEYIQGNYTDEENGRGVQLIESMADEFVCLENGRVAQIDFYLNKKND